MVSSNGDQYHQIHENLGQQQEYVMRSPNRSPSSPIIAPKSSISKHSRIGEYQGKFQVYFPEKIKSDNIFIIQN